MDEEAQWIDPRKHSAADAYIHNYAIFTQSSPAFFSTQCQRVEGSSTKPALARKGAAMMSERGGSARLRPDVSGSACMPFTLFARKSL